MIPDGYNVPSLKMIRFPNVFLLVLSVAAHRKSWIHYEFNSYHTACIILYLLAYLSTIAPHAIRRILLITFRWNRSESLLLSFTNVNLCTNWHIASFHDSSRIKIVQFSLKCNWHANIDPSRWCQHLKHFTISDRQRGGRSTLSCNGNFVIPSLGPNVTIDTCFDIIGCYSIAKIVLERNVSCDGYEKKCRCEILWPISFHWIAWKILWLLIYDSTVGISEVLNICRDYKAYFMGVLIGTNSEDSRLDWLGVCIWLTPKFQKLQVWQVYWTFCSKGRKVWQTLEWSSFSFEKSESEANLLAILR